MKNAIIMTISIIVGGILGILSAIVLWFTALSLLPYIL